MEDMHVSAGGLYFCKDQGFERGLLPPTYVPTLVLPSLAHTCFLGRREDEKTGITRLRAKVVIHEGVRALMLKIEQ